MILRMILRVPNLDLEIVENFIINMILQFELSSKDPKQLRKLTLSGLLKEFGFVCYASRTYLCKTNSENENENENPEDIDFQEILIADYNGDNIFLKNIIQYFNVIHSNSKCGSGSYLKEIFYVYANPLDDMKGYVIKKTSTTDLEVTNF